MDLWPSTYAKQLKQFVSMRFFWNISFLTKKASFGKSTFLLVDREKNIRSNRDLVNKHHFSCIVYIISRKKNHYCDSLKNLSKLTYYEAWFAEQIDG